MLSILYRNKQMLQRNKYSIILPTVLISQYSTGFKWKNMFVKSEAKKDSDVTSASTPSSFGSDFLNRIQSRALDDYTKRALAGISDAINKNRTCTGTSSSPITKPEQPDVVDPESIYDRVPEVFAAFQMSLSDNKLKAQLTKLLDRNCSTSSSTSLSGQTGVETKKLRTSADLYDIIPSSVLDEKTKGYLRELSTLGDKLRSQFEKSTMNLQHPFAINLGLLRLYIMHQSAQQSPLLGASSSSPAAAASPISETFIAEAKYFLRFAADVYDDKPFISSDDILLDQLGEHTHVSANVKVPRHVVFLDHLTKSVVVSIRGTGSVSDVLTDLHLDSRPFMRAKDGHISAGAVAASAAANAEGGGGGLGLLEKAFDMAAHRVRTSIDNTLLTISPTGGALYAHKGMADSAHALLEPVVAAIHDAHNRRAGRYRNYQIVVTGHSLGAGTGSLLGMLLAANTSLPVKTFAFAPPPVISRDIYPVDKLSPGTVTSDLPQGGPHSNCIIYSFINHNDVVPRASHHELLNLLSAIGSVDSLPWTPTDRSLLLLRGKLTPEEAQQMEQHLAVAENYHEENEGVELCVPGHVYWLRRDGVVVSNGGKRDFSKASRFSDLNARRYRVLQLVDSSKLFNGYLYTGDSMVADHLVVNYMDAFLNINSSDKVI